MVIAKLCKIDEQQKQYQIPPKCHIIFTYSVSVQ